MTLLTYLRPLLLVEEHMLPTSPLHPTLSWAILFSPFQFSFILFIFASISRPNMYFWTSALPLPFRISSQDLPRDAFWWIVQCMFYPFPSCFSSFLFRRMLICFWPQKLLLTVSGHLMLSIMHKNLCLIDYDCNSSSNFSSVK